MYEVLLFHDASFSSCAKQERFENEQALWAYLYRKMPHGEYESAEVYKGPELILTFSILGVKA